MRKWMLHAAAAAGFVVFGALALGSANRPPPTQAPPPQEPAGAALDDFWWAAPADNEGVRITQYVGAARNVTIPDEIQGRPVTEIGARAFMGGAHLTGVVLPAGVIHIWDRAFANNRLTNVVIPDGVVTIGGWAFEMNSLIGVNIPDSVIFIWSGAFANNPALASITLGNGVGALCESVFAGSLRNVTRISIGANVQLQSSGPSCFVWSSFRAAYEANRHRAGIYTFDSGAGQWSWQPR